MSNKTSERRDETKTASSFFDDLRETFAKFGFKAPERTSVVSSEHDETTSSPEAHEGDQKPSGVTYLDLLVGMAVFAFLALICMTALNGFIERAEQAENNSLENSSQVDVP